jgi:hypothetical protein
MWSYSLSILTPQDILVYYVPTESITSQWTPSSGTSNFSLVNEVEPDDNTYVFALLNNKVDEYYLPPILQPPANTNLVFKARIKTISTMAVKVGLYSGSTLIQESDSLTSTDSFQTLSIVIPYATWSTSFINWGNVRIRITSIV